MAEIELAAAAEHVAEAGPVAARRRRTSLAGLVLVTGSERRLVVHGFAQRREERVVVEHLGLETLAGSRHGRLRRGGRGRRGRLVERGAGAAPPARSKSDCTSIAWVDASGA